jgi:predicted NAD-dependent protein-ADP-ribosyltransferase YbiA (DUF1768 family)
MANVPKRILFYNEREEPYGVFANFSPHPVNINEKKIPNYRALFSGNYHAIYLVIRADVS